MTSVVALSGAFRHTRISAINTRAIGAFVSMRAGTVSNATIKRDLTALSRLLSSCVQWGWIDANPARSFDRSNIRERRDPIRPPSQADFATALPYFPLPMQHILTLMKETGMRENEAVMLERAEIDPVAEQINLTVTKADRPRSIPWRTIAADAGPVLALGAASGVLFPSREGEPYAQFATNFGEVMRKVVRIEEAAGRAFRRFRAHDLRHWFAIRWLKAGGGIYGLKGQLGHTSVKTTERYLAYLTLEEADRVKRAG